LVNDRVYLKEGIRKTKAGRLKKRKKGEI